MYKTKFLGAISSSLSPTVTFSPPVHVPTFYPSVQQIS